MPILTFNSGGDINPSRFVTHSTSADFTAEEADAGEFILGISQEGPKNAPIPGASALAAEAGDQVSVYSVGEVCYLQAGTGVTRGDLLKSDADGKGVPAGTGDFYGAQAHQSGVADELIRVEVIKGKK